MEAQNIQPGCVIWGLMRNRCQDKIRFARDSLRETVVKNKGKREQE